VKLQIMKISNALCAEEVPNSVSSNPVQTNDILDNRYSPCHISLNQCISSSDNSSLPVDKKHVSINPLDLNWMDRSELISQADVLSETQRRLINQLVVKERDFSKGFENGNYFMNALPIIASDVKFSQRFVQCGRHQGSARVHCEKPMFCSKCAEADGNRALGMYYNSFERGTFHFVTISFKGSVPFDSLNSSHMLAYWNAVDGAFKHLCSQDIVDGAYWVDELAIHDFFPLRVLPHGHAIIDSGAFTDEDVNEILEYLAENHSDLELKPSIEFTRIPDRYDFIRRIKYCNKSINLARPYETGVAYIDEASGRTMNALNREMRDFLEGVPVTTLGRKRIHRAGTMLPQCKSRYIGTNAKQRKRSFKAAMAAMR